MRILLIEDDELTGDGLQQFLQQQGHAVDWLRDGDGAAGALDGSHFDAVILDILLPGQSGVELLSQWRDHHKAVPVLLLTALDGIDEKVKGLDAGADDYVTKPVDFAELMARLRALVRRAERRNSDWISFGSLHVDLTCHDVFVGDERMRLSRHEYALIEALIDRPGRTLSREQLESRLYGWADGPSSNSLEVHIHRLRCKLGRGRIETVRGLGYRLTVPS